MDEWINKIPHIFTRGIYLSQKKEWSTDIGMNEPLKHNAKGKMLDTKDHLSYDSIYTEYLE